MTERRRGLGRGIGALIPSGPPTTETDDGPETSEDRDSAVRRPTDVFFAATPTSPDSAASGTNGSSDRGNGQLRSVGSSSTARSLMSPPERPRKNARRRTTADAAAAPTAHEPDATPAPDDLPPRGRPSASTPAESDGLLPVPGATFAEIPVGEIVRNARQPRQVFDEEELDELAASIREVGVLQPIVVRPLTTTADDPDARYELIMGERRWRAAQQAGLDAVPAVIRETGDGDLLRDALLENLHRTQLNPLEEAAAYQALLEDFGCTHDELAGRIARSRPQISNTLRLLKLPPLVQRRVAAGVLSAGHARALLGLADPAAMERLAQKIVAEGLSVRATEEIVALGDEPIAPEMRRRPRTTAHTEELNRLATRLSDRLDTRVKVNLGQRKGRIAIEFAGVDDLNRILDVLAPGEPPVPAGVDGGTEPGISR